METYNKTEHIIDVIINANEAYYNDSDPIMPDSEYDSLKDRLRELDPNNKLLSKVGHPVGVTEWNKAKHKIPMSSLNKCNSQEEFSKWSSEMGVDAFVIEDKLDGIAIDLEYVGGILKKAITRGDGIEGEDILANVEQMQNVKLWLPNYFTGSIRGEIFLLSEDFEKINKLCREKGEKELKNPRNGAAGTAKKLNGEYSKHLTILYYDITTPNPFTTESSKMSYINNIFGLKTSFYKKVTASEAIKVYNEYENGLRIKTPYAIDGLVIKTDDIAVQNRHGKLGNNPKAQIAWKFGSMTAVSEVVGVTWELGNNRRITPVIHIEPTEVGGVTVRKMTSHNLDYFNKLGIVKGCHLLFKRANDVIPVPVKVDHYPDPNHGAAIVAPDKCYVCGALLKTEDKYLICPNNNCEGLALGNLIKWIIKLDIKDIAESTVKALYDAGKIKEPSDFYMLKVSDISSLERLGEKSATKILKHFNEKKEISLPVFVGGLNIDGFGERLTETLVEAGFDTLVKLMNASVLDIVKVKGFESKTARLVVLGMSNKAAVIMNLLDAGIVIKEPEKKESTNGVLSGKSFCFTGAINKTDCNGNRYTRNMMHDIVLKNGGQAETSVKSGLDYLVMADPNSTSSKTHKAIKNCVEIISEENFFKMLGV